MGICKPRYYMLTICFLQLLSVVERQVFDFLGFLWIPILINFFEIIFIIFGFFGSFQYRPKYLLWYAIWNILYFGWNIFLICLYFDIDTLNHKESKVLKLDPDSGSWWENGPGCKAVLNTTAPIPTWQEVTNCVIDYRYVEVFQAGLQCILSFLGIITALCLSKMFLEEDDSLSRKSQQKKTKRRRSLYSIEISPQTDGPQNCDNANSYDRAPVSPKPMTPRRVKRRSVMTRGSSNRQSSTSRRHSARSSTRSSRRTTTNPVTRLMAQQQSQRMPSSYDSATSPSPTEPLPNYYANSVSNTNLLHQNWSVNGHTNPTYQQSSIQSLNEPDELDDLYNNRPASVRSSYSNFHGTRTMKYTIHQQLYNQATPQVPQKRATNANRQSVRSTKFLNNGPPVYTYQGQAVPVDSETTI